MIGDRFRLNDLLIVLFLILPSLHNLIYSNEVQEIKLNGDFERDFKTIKDISKNWIMWGHADGQITENVTQDHVEAQSGKACLKILRKANPKTWSGLISTNPWTNKVEVKKNTIYELSFWAKSNLPGDSKVSLMLFKSLNPLENSRSQVDLENYYVSKNWQEFKFSIKADEDFYTDDANYLTVLFFPSIGSLLNTDRILWLDQITLKETTVSDSSKRLISSKDLKTKYFKPILDKASSDSLTLKINANDIIRKTNKKVTGLSISSLGRWHGPFSKKGKYILAPELENSVRELNLPLTRLYGLNDNEVFDGKMNTSLDKTKWLLDKLSIPTNATIIEPENYLANQKLTIQEWKDLVLHSKKNNLGFQYWEVGNEVYVSLWGKEHGGMAFKSAKHYVDHFIKVSKAIKEIQPNAKVGISIYPSHIKWGNYVLLKATGYYDFVCPHFYGFPKATSSLEKIVLEDNMKVLKDVQDLNALIKYYNLNKDIHIYDSEWGLHSASSTNKAWALNMNSNVIGTLYRAVRMLYYAREDLVLGASGWALFDSSYNSGFLTVPIDKPQHKTTMYWLYYYMNRFLGQNVLKLSGEAPYYTNSSFSTILTPTMATINEDNNKIFLIIINASQEKEVNTFVEFESFSIYSHKGIYLSHDDMLSHPVLENKSDYVHNLKITQETKCKIKLSLPPHSISFMEFSKLE